MSKHAPAGFLLVALLLLVGCSSQSNSQNALPEQLYSSAPPKAEPPTELTLTIPRTIVINGDSVTISGQAERGATVRVVGNSSSGISTTFKIPEAGTGTSFSIVISPLASGRHSLQVKASISGKKETAIPVTVERPLTALQFDITGEYVGQGEIQASIQTNLWEGTEVAVEVFSISALNPGYADEDGIDHSRWYRQISAAVKGLHITKVIPENWEVANSLTIPTSGVTEVSTLLFHPEALRHAFSEIETMQIKSDQDSMLLRSLAQRRTFERDGRVILDFRISQHKFNEATNQRENNLKDMDISSIKLPKSCKLLTYDFYGNSVTDIQCTKEITASKSIITADKTRGATEQKAEAAAREVKECSILTNTLCYFYVHKQGNVTWQQAKDDCAERGGDLPLKTDAAAVREGLETLYESYPKLMFVWTKERKDGYGWVEGFIKNFEGEYLSSWATAHSDKRDYVSYVCVKKR